MSVEIFASKFPNVIIVMESYKRLTITLLHVSCMLVSRVRTILSKVCDVGDLPVQVLSFGFGNWVLKAEWLSGLCGRPTFFYVFFRFQKTRLFTFFELLHTFSRTLVAGSQPPTINNGSSWNATAVVPRNDEQMLPAPDNPIRSRQAIETQSEQIQWKQCTVYTVGLGLIYTYNDRTVTHSYIIY